jgi:uncharacterized protein (TIGR02145 family)
LEEVIAKSTVGEYSMTAATAWESSYRTLAGTRGTHGQKMKSTMAVNGYATSGTSKSGMSNGFNALLVGYVYNSSAYGYSMFAAFWSSSSYSSSNAWNRGLGYIGTGANRNYDGKSSMFSVRCKKD